MSKLTVRPSRHDRAGFAAMVAGGLALAVFLAIAPAGGAGPSIVAGEAFYPEGPLWQDGRLLYAEMTRNRVMAWNGETSEVFWQGEDCGPTAIAPAGEGTYLVLCHLGHRLLRVSRTGGTIGAIDREVQGRAIVFPNDAAADGRGGIYISSSGPFDKTASWSGAVLYVDAGGMPRRVADGIRYANGVAVSPDGSALYVSEHLLRRVLRYRIGPDGALSGREVFFDLDEAIPRAADADGLSGPDGLEFDATGLLWIAEYGAGRILAVDPARRLRHVVSLPDKYTTNVAVGPDGRTLFVTASSSNRVEPYVGRVFRIDEPSARGPDGG